jgi:hypothetical protein
MSKILFCIPSYRGIIYPAFKESFERGTKAVANSGHLVAYRTFKGHSLIPLVRATIIRDFLSTQADILFMLDDDLSWGVEDMLAMINTEGDVISGAYRLKTDTVFFPVLPYKDKDKDEQMQIREDGCVRAEKVAGGFLKITRDCLTKMCKAYPEREFEDKAFDGTSKLGCWDFFPVGVHNGIYQGEDYGFCRLWTEIGGEIWIYPDITFNHYSESGKYYRGNYWQYLKETVLKLEPLPAMV